MAKAVTRARVPVAAVMVEAYRGVFGRLSLLLELAWLPLLLVLAAAILPGYLQLYRGVGAIPAWPGDAFGLTVDDLVEALVGLLCLSAFAVRWYQTLLFNHGRVPSGIFLGAWLRFLLYMLLLYLVAAVLLSAMVLADIAGAPGYAAPVAGAGMIAAWLAPVRCSLLFPAAARGKPLSLAAAWRAMRGNTWRLFATVMLVSIPTVFAVAMLISSIAALLGLDSGSDAPPPLGFFILRGVISSCADFIVVALGASVAAGFYRRIDPDAPEQRGDQPWGDTAPGSE
ncbi:MAG TPA: hypothetical protein VGL83_11970 [Stellaceae bacterium]|jgi:hypothetical protein